MISRYGFARYREIEGSARVPFPEYHDGASQDAAVRYRLATYASALRLADFDPGLTAGFKRKHDARNKLRGDLKHLASLQDTLYADRRYALLIIFQGMNASPKGDHLRMLKNIAGRATRAPSRSRRDVRERNTWGMNRFRFANRR